jgi:hypothetical protein
MQNIGSVAPVTIDQIFASGTDTIYAVTLVSHNTDGLVAYATGKIALTKPQDFGAFFRSATLATKSGSNLEQIFSDRRRDIDPPPAPTPDTPVFRSSPRQQFDDDARDQIGLDIYEQWPFFHSRSPTGVFDPGPRHAYGATIKFASWGGGKISFGLDKIGDFLVGIGPRSPTAGFPDNPKQSSIMISFQQMPIPPR